MSNTKLTFIHALSPLHAGTGQGVGVIDLPIAREKATGVPYLPGSSLKGTLRDVCTHPKKKEVFGPENDNAAEYAGSVQFTDQRLLLLPVRSLKGTFAWVTSPFLLQRFVRDAVNAGESAACFSQLPAPVFTPKTDTQAEVVECCVANDTLVLTDGKVVLEDLDMTTKTNDTATKAWATFLGLRLFDNNLTGRLCVVPDDVMNFLVQSATEITARIRLQSEHKTVERGGLWYEEALPAESVLYGLCVATKIKVDNEAEVFAAVRNAIWNAKKQPRPLQFGGKATVGRGLCYVHLAPDQATATGGQG